MKLYRITTKNGQELLIESDKVEVLNSGQIVLSKNNEVISIFCKETDIICAEDDRTNYNDSLKYNAEKMQLDIALIDESFFSDVFLKNNSIEDASDKLRRISMLVIKTIDVLQYHRI